MDAKHRLAQILAIAILLIATIYSFYVVMGFITENPSDLWLLATHLLNVAVCVYLFSAAIRMLEWVKGSPFVQPGRIKWGRVLLGVLFAFYAMKTQLHPPASAADIDIPIRKVEGEATIALYIAVALLGVALAVSGILAKHKRPAPEPILEKRPHVPWP